MEYVRKDLIRSEINASVRETAPYFRSKRDRSSELTLATISVG